MERAVRLEDVRKTYLVGEPVHAVDGVSLELERGSFTAIMGPSGSGKSTLMNLIGCLDTASEGTLWVADHEVGKLSESERTALRGQEIGFIFQTFNLMPKLTARHNVALPLVFQGVSRHERLERAEALLAQVGLAERADHKPSELSGGQRQRVAIARALVNDPTLLLADEPTGNVDSDTGRQIMELFEDLHARGNTVVLVTHERRVASWADSIVHLLDGKIDRVEKDSDGEEA